MDPPSDPDDPEDDAVEPPSEPREDELSPSRPEDELGIEGMPPLEPLEPTLGMPPLEPELPDELDDDDELGFELPDEEDDEEDGLGIEGDELPELPDEDALGMLGAPELLEDCCCCVDSQLASSMLIAAAWARTRACLRNFDTLMMQILFRAAGFDMLCSPELQVNTDNDTPVRLFTDETADASIIMRKYLNTN